MYRKDHNRKYYNKFIRLVYFIIDFIVINTTFCVAHYIKFNSLNVTSTNYLYFLTIYNLSWYLVVFIFKVHETKHVFSISRAMIKVMKAIVVHFLIMSALIYARKYEIFSRADFFLTYILLIIILPASRLLLLYSLLLYRKYGFNFKNVVIIGAGAVGGQIYRFIKSDRSLGFRFKGFLDDDPDNSLYKEEIVGPITDFKEFCIKEEIDEVFCALPLTASDTINEMIEFSDSQLIRIRIIPDFAAVLNKKVNLQFYDNVPVLSIRQEPLESLSNRAIKRAFDIVFSLFVLIFIFPIIFTIVALIIKLESKGPVFFKQLRTGKDNKQFYCLKFRTMRVNNDSDSRQATANDDRTTKIGRILRKTSIDELPQFLNVLMGDMSVVGPRPHMLKHTDEYSKIIDKFMVRHFAKPGITGSAQVNGYRGATTDPELMRRRVKYDVFYIENWSLWLDIVIIIKTVTNIFKGEKNAI